MVKSAGTLIGKQSSPHVDRQQSGRNYRLSDMSRAVESTSGAAYGLVGSFAASPEPNESKLSITARICRVAASTVSTTSVNALCIGGIRQVPAAGARMSCLSGAETPRRHVRGIMGCAAFPLTVWTVAVGSTQSPRHAQKGVPPTSSSTSRSSGFSNTFSTLAAIRSSWSYVTISIR